MYLVVATSGRAIAQGIKASGSTAAVIDGFADIDTCAASEVCKKVRRANVGLSAKEILYAVESLRDELMFEGLLYDAVLECNPDLLDSLSIDKVTGNSSQTLRSCRDPKIFFSALDQYAIPYPEISFEPIQNFTDSWLIKHAISSGGTGISAYSEEGISEKNVYFQRKVEGVSFSLTFLANGDELKPIGFNTLWCEVLGKSMPYAYAGAINSADLTEQQQNTVVNYATTLTRKFNLIGLNSIDCILSEGCIYVLEINPRIPATYELYETKYGDLMKQHIDACVHLKLAATQDKQLLRAHAIVYAPKLIRVPASLDWPLWTADRPHQEEVIHKYEPVCSVFSGGKNVAQVSEMIHTRKKTILRKLMHS